MFRCNDEFKVLRDAKLCKRAFKEQLDPFRLKMPGLGNNAIDDG